jgi:hypothetical protein
LQVEAVRLRIHGLRGLEGSHDTTDAARNIVSDFALQSENPTDVALVSFRPEMHIGGDLDQLGRDADAVAGAGDGSFDDGVDVQLATDVLDAFPGLLVAHDAGARDHAHASHLGEVGNERIRHAIREVGLLRISGEILERQNGDCGYLGMRVELADNPVPNASDVCRNQDHEGSHCGRSHQNRAPVVATCRIALGFRFERWKVGHLTRHRLGVRHRGNESISLAREGLDKPRALGGITQGFPQVVDGLIQSAVEVDEGSVGPKPPD